jgi:hypothetical protein
MLLEIKSNPTTPKRGIGVDTANSGATRKIVKRKSPGQTDKTILRARGIFIGLLSG